MEDNDKTNIGKINKQSLLGKKPFLKRFWLLGLIILFVLVGIWAIMSLVINPKEKIGPANDQVNNGPAIPQAKDNEEKVAWPSIDARYITAVPLDLTQIQSISKYRSCAGHDFSGYNFEQTLETNRSMKHYIYPVPEFQGTIDKVKMFAPFDGTVSKIDAETDQIGKPGKRPQTGNGITFSTPIDANVRFQFSHIYFTKDFKVGDKVNTGELIGYASLGEKRFDFDIDLTAKIFIDGKNAEVFGSVFDHMTDNVLTEFAKYGITPENTRFSAEYRDLHPCNYSQSEQDDRAGINWVSVSR
jgi:hypothetical protein